MPVNTIRSRRSIPISFPNRDIRVTDEFLHENEELLVYFGRNLLAAALDTQDAVDNDVREALESLIRTYRTLESGVYYESRPQNPLAGAIYSTHPGGRHGIAAHGKRRARRGTHAR